MGFHKAQKLIMRLRLWLNSMSSGGKTFSALRMATGMGGKIALIDTEAGRGNAYANEFDYDVCEIEKPHTPEKMIAAIHEAEKAGYDIIIIDSATHVWKEVLEIKGKLDEKGGNNYTNWAMPTRRYDQFTEAINQSPCHVIITSRVKRDHVLEADADGKMKPKYVGLGNVLRDDASYDMTLELRIDKDDHRATPIKDNTRLFTEIDSDGVQVACEPFLITEDTGKQVMEWLNDGVVTCEKCQGAKATEKADNGKIYCASCHRKYLVWSEQQKDPLISKEEAETKVDKMLKDKDSEFNKPTNNPPTKEDNK